MLFGWELKEPKERKRRGDWVAKMSMMGFPVEIIKTKKENGN